MLVGELCGCWALAVLAARNIANRAKLVLLMSVDPIAISQGLAAYRLPPQSNDGGRCNRSEVWLKPCEYDTPAPVLQVVDRASPSALGKC